MAVEIEAKYRAASIAAVRERLVAAGAERQGATFEVNRIFDTPDEQLRKADSALRLRTQRPLYVAGRDEHLVTYKSKRPDLAPGGAAPVKMREELETFVGDGAVFLALLGRLGYRPVIVYEKRRETWRLGDTCVELDELPQLGGFIEVEAPTAARVAAVVDQLALRAEDLVPESYIALTARHGAVQPDGVRALLFAGPEERVAAAASGEKE